MHWKPSTVCVMTWQASQRPTSAVASWLPGCCCCCRVWRLAVPLMVNNIAGYALSIVGAIYIGRLGSLQLSASVLANSLYNCTGLSLALGLSAGMETLCGQVRVKLGTFPLVCRCCTCSSTLSP
jgi:hypothetical protein